MSTSLVKEASTTIKDMADGSSPPPSTDRIAITGESSSASAPISKPHIHVVNSNAIDLRQLNDNDSSQDLDSDGNSSRRTFRERAVDFLSIKSKKQQQQHKSIDVLNARQLTSKNIEVFEDGGDVKYVATKTTIQLGTGQDQDPRSSIVACSIADRTGYKSARMGSSGPSNIETQSIASGIEGRIMKSPSDSTGAQYTQMSNLRNTRISSMLLRSTSKEGLVVETPKSATSPRSFKEFYISLLTEHDHKQQLHLGQNRNPKLYRLETFFGTRGDGIDPFDRMMWMAGGYKSIRADAAWSSTQDQIKLPPSPRKSQPERVVDINLDEGPNGLVYDGTITPGLEIVMSGRPKALLDGLIFPLNQDMSYAEVFLATYRYFLEPLDLIDSLISWFKVTAVGSQMPNAEAALGRSKKFIETRCIRVLLLWIKNHWQDFHDAPVLHTELEIFIAYLFKESPGNYQKIIHATREQRLSWYTYQYIPMFSDVRAVDASKIWGPDMNTDLFAHNLTMLDHLFFRKMRPDQYLQILAVPGTIFGGGFNVPLKTLLEYCGWTRMVVSYVSTVIQKEDTTKKRTMAIRLLLKIAKTCLDLGNYHGALAITYGLKQPTSIMWIGAWEALPAKYLHLFKELNLLIEYKDGYSNYWETIEKATMPAIPFLVPYIHDLLFIHENCPVTCDDVTDSSVKRINFAKYYDMYSVAAELENFRLTSYHNILEGDKESNGILLQHIRQVAKEDDISLGLQVVFSSGTIPDGNEAINSPSGLRAMKKLVALMSGKAEEHSEAFASLS